VVPADATNMASAMTLEVVACYNYSTFPEQKEEEDRNLEEGGSIDSVQLFDPVFLRTLSLSTGTATWAYMDHLSNEKRELGL
jgi:hypothetical protein